ncbi:MAG: nitroreductase, partial [Pseudomonadota bacterium]
APSGGNVQPWKVDVLLGARLDDFKALIQEKLARGELEEPQYDVYPKGLWEPHRSYRYKVGEDMYGLVGIGREDKLARMGQLAKNFQFFGAPVGMFFTLDPRFGPPQWSDVGMYMQTLMLLATEAGLDTCAQESWSRWPQTVIEFCGLPEGAIVFSGMALGFRDDEHPINRLRADRAGLDDFATFHE